MADGIYIGMAGAAARAEQLDSIADNLANAQTPGFKASRPAFESFLPVSGAQDKAYPAAVQTAFDLTPGALMHTGEGLDITPENGAFLAVRNGQGQVSYTRNGKMLVDQDGFLKIAGNLVLQSNGQPLNFPQGTRPTIETNGQVRIGDQIVGDLGLFTLEGPLARTGGSLLTPSEGGKAVPVTKGGVRVGELELSNAPALESAIALVSAQRNYETSLQAVQTYRRLDERASEVGRVR